MSAFLEALARRRAWLTEQLAQHADPASAEHQQIAEALRECDRLERLPAPTGTIPCLGGPKDGALWTTPLPTIGRFDERRDVLGMDGEVAGAYIWARVPFPHWRWVQARHYMVDPHGRLRHAHKD